MEGRKGMLMGMDGRKGMLMGWWPKIGSNVVFFRVLIKKYFKNRFKIRLYVTLVIEMSSQ